MVLDVTVLIVRILDVVAGTMVHVTKVKVTAIGTASVRMAFNVVGTTADVTSQRTKLFGGGDMIAAFVRINNFNQIPSSLLNSSVITIKSS